MGNRVNNTKGYKTLRSHTNRTDMNIVNLEEDAFGKHKCTKTFVALIKFMSAEGVGKNNF